MYIFFSVKKNANIIIDNNCILYKSVCIELLNIIDVEKGDKMEEFTFYNANGVITKLTELAKKRTLVFRGYGKQSELFPNIIRDTDLTNREIELLSAFEKYGLQYFSVNSAIDFMSYAQHFGLPTRLLDFTYNPFIALFFALFMPKNTKYANPDDKDYYYIRYCDLSDQIVFNSLPAQISVDDKFFTADSFVFQCKKSIDTIDEILKLLWAENKGDDDPDLRNIIMYFKTIYRTTHDHDGVSDIHQFKVYIDELIDKFEGERILFIDANQCNNRIIMQQGLFMFPYDLAKDKHRSILVQNTNLIKIHKDARPDLLEFLETMGLNSYRLMPDLQSVCYAIKRKIIEERKESSTLFKKKRR